MKTSDNTTSSSHAPRGVLAPRLSLVLVMALLGCDGSGSDAPPVIVVQVTDYDTRCTSNDECTVATGGDVCAPCTCPDTPIRKDRAADFAERQRAAKEGCHDTSGILCGPCAAELPPASCSPASGRCITTR